MSQRHGRDVYKRQEYIFEYVGQGADGDELYAEVMDSEGNIIAKGDNVTLTGWKNWKLSLIHI